MDRDFHFVNSDGLKNSGIDTLAKYEHICLQRSLGYETLTPKIQLIDRYSPGLPYYHKTMVSQSFQRLLPVCCPGPQVWLSKPQHKVKCFPLLF